MHRAVVLTTLVLLLLAVAGVSVAQENGIFAAGSNSAAPPESTTPEDTSLGATVAEEAETNPSPGASSKPDDGEDTSEPTVFTEPTVVAEPTVAAEPTVVAEPAVDEETEEATVVPPVEEMLPPGSNKVDKPENSGRGVDKPEQAGKPPKIGKPRGDGGHPGKGKPGKGKPAERGNEQEHGRGGGQHKVTLCHKDKITLTVGAPAQAAHMRHGDSLGAC